MRTTAELVGVRLLLVPFVAIALTVGCGKENVVQSTTGPSTLTSAAALSGDPNDGESTSSIAGEAGTLEKGGNGHGNKGNSDGDEGNGDDDGNDDDGKKPQNGNGPGRSHEDRVVGFVSAKTADTLTVRGVTVTAAAGAIIRHGHRILTLADIQVGDHVQARGTMDGSTLVATEIKVQDTGNDNEDDDGDVDETELEGTISNLSSNGQLSGRDIHDWRRNGEDIGGHRIRRCDVRESRKQCTRRSRGDRAGRRVDSGHQGRSRSGSGRSGWNRLRVLWLRELSGGHLQGWPDAQFSDNHYHDCLDDVFRRDVRNVIERGNSRSGRDQAGQRLDYRRVCRAQVTNGSRRSCRRDPFSIRGPGNSNVSVAPVQRPG